MKYILSFLLSLFIAMPVFSQIQITGSVKDANGKAPILAHAHIGVYNGDAKKTTSVQCSKDGHFTIALPKAGIYSLRISAVNHQEISIPLILNEKDRSVEMNVQLRANTYNPNPEKITVIGDWNKFAFASTEQMTPQKEGGDRTLFSYERTATGDTLSYQLIGTAEGGHSVNGETADYFTYDGGGDYRSVLHTKKGEKVTISFDPSKINYSLNADLPNVNITNNLFLKNIYDLTKVIDNMHMMDTILYSGGIAIKPSEKHAAILSSIRQLYQATLASGDTNYSQFAAVMFAKEFDGEMNFGSENADFVMNAVPASSPYWAMAPIEINSIASAGDTKLNEFYQKGLKNNPVRSVRGVAYATEMMRAVDTKNTKEWKRLYAMLKSEYGDVPELKWTLVQNNPDALIQVGNYIQPFEVTLLDGSRKVSNTSMLGKYYMIDFWATWCGPCVREMPAIHKAYEKFKGREGFEIISLSMDADEADIAPFRAKKWKMPWLHAFIPGIFDSELAKRFEVAGIPKPILVGPDGKIRAIQEQLRSEELESTLRRFLGESN